MTQLDEIMESGKAPNDEVNASTKEANQMAAYFTALFESVPNAKVLGLVINTTVAGAMGSAELIPLENVEPQPDEDERFYYHLQVRLPLGVTQEWAVSSWLTAVEVRGLELATRDYMAKVDSSFSYLNVPQVYSALETGLAEFYESC